MRLRPEPVTSSNEPYRRSKDSGRVKFRVNYTPNQVPDPAPAPPCTMSLSILVPAEERGGHMVGKIMDPLKGPCPNP